MFADFAAQIDLVPGLHADSDRQYDADNHHHSAGPYTSSFFDYRNRLMTCQSHRRER